MTVAELAARMSLREFNEWLAEERLRQEDDVLAGLAERATAELERRRGR